MSWQKTLISIAAILHITISRLSRYHGVLLLDLAMLLWALLTPAAAVLIKAVKAQVNR